MRKPFNLQEWLIDKSQKVVTRENIPVIIFTTDFNGDGSNILCGRIGNDEYPTLWTSQGYYTDEGYPHRSNLFFVTEEELTEFERAVFDCIDETVVNYIDDYTPETRVDLIQSQAEKWADKLLSIARKQIEAEKKRTPSP